MKNSNILVIYWYTLDIFKLNHGKVNARVIDELSELGESAVQSLWSRFFNQLKVLNLLKNLRSYYNLKVCINVTDQQVWELRGVSLINDSTTDNKGLLFVTVANKQNRSKEKRGTVCVRGFNWRLAQLLCRKIGFVFADWGSFPRNMKYFAR